MNGAAVDGLGTGAIDALPGVWRKTDGTAVDSAMHPFPEVLSSTTEMAATEGDDRVGALERPMHTGPF